MKNKKLNNKGFSLVELIIVIAIMVILVAVIAPQYLKFVNNSRVSTDVQTASDLVTAVNVAIADGNAAFSGANTLDFDKIENVSAMPTSRFTNASFSVEGDNTDGVTKVYLTTSSGTNAKATGKFEVYPNPDNTSDGINDETNGLRK